MLLSRSILRPYRARCQGGHIRLLVTLRTRLAIAKAVQLDKGRIIGLDSSKISKPPKLRLATGDGVFSVGISQARSITLSSSSNTTGHKPFKKKYLVFLKKHGGHLDNEQGPAGTKALIIPYPTERFFEGRFPRHFVPGYDRLVPPGQKPFAHRRTSH